VISVTDRDDWATDKIDVIVRGDAVICELILPQQLDYVSKILHPILEDIAIGAVR